MNKDFIQKHEAKLLIAGFIILIVFLILIFYVMQDNQVDDKNSKGEPVDEILDKMEENKDFNEVPLKDILKKAENVTNFEYDLKATLNGVTSNAKVYFSEEKYRFEETEKKKAVIFDVERHRYIYDYETNSYSRVWYPNGTDDLREYQMMKYDLHHISKHALACANQYPECSCINECSNEIRIKELGKEKLNGLNTRVIEFPYKEWPGGREIKTIKAWVSEEYGIALKLESRNSETQAIEYETELSNFKINSVQESMFEIPEEAKTGVNEVCEETEEAYSEETTEEILAKAKQPKNIEYYISSRYVEDGTKSVINPPKEVYQKDNKYLIKNIATATIYVSDGENIYQYFNDKDAYLKLEGSQAFTTEKPFDFEDYAEQALNDPEMKEIGKEKICNLNTRIIEFNYDKFKKNYPNMDMPKYKTKMWISEKQGIIVKVELEDTKIEETGLVERIELKSIKFNSVEDSLFEVPAEKIKTRDEIYYGK